MPIKLLKKETKNAFTIERALHAKNYSLTIDKFKCKGCGICMETCSGEAIQVTRTPKTDGKKAKSPTLKINEKKCHYCGICEALCPFGAIKIKINGKGINPVVRTESFPQLIREIKIDESKAGEENLDFEEICPLDLIKVNIYDKEEKVKNKVFKSEEKKVNFKIKIEKEYCPCCRICETKFPYGTIHVEKIFYGNLRINQKKCPNGCHDCVDTCPIPGVLTLSNKGDVQVNEFNCIYCGVCKIACPEENALEINRVKIRHTQVHSGAWNKALEKIASTSAVIKELENKNARKLKGAILKRFPPEEMDDNV
ncbi:4Fe-4S dicluster domain-containing protein [Candidatus Bathyarchaeota archaeon]|nr:4Fe-4S dicluster domain-containing protein [Candidatus Bathyarchaeota archaeon]